MHLVCYGLGAFIFLIFGSIISSRSDNANKINSYVGQLSAVYAYDGIAKLNEGEISVYNRCSVPAFVPDPDLDPGKGLRIAI